MCHRPCIQNATITDRNRWRLCENVRVERIRWSFDPWRGNDRRSWAVLTRRLLADAASALVFTRPRCKAPADANRGEDRRQLTLDPAVRHLVTAPSACSRSSDRDRLNATRPRDRQASRVRETASPTSIGRWSSDRGQSDAPRRATAGIQSSQSTSRVQSCA